MKTISISNLKGGVGKSALTLQIANHLAQEKKASVVIVDCDSAQKTCYNQFTIADNPLYDVIVMEPNSDSLIFQQKLRNTLEDLKAYDYVFFDIPGTIMQKGVLTLLQVIDKIIVPTFFSPNELDSTRIFLELIQSNDVGRESSDIKVLFNKIRPYRDQEHRELIEMLSNEEGLNKLSNFLSISPESFFTTVIKEEQAAIEKKTDVENFGKKMNERYGSFFSEDVYKFINS